MDASSSFLDGLVDLPPMGSSNNMPTMQIKPEPQDIPPIISAVNMSIGVKQEPQDDFSLSNSSCSMSSPDMTAASSVGIKQEPNDGLGCSNNTGDAAVSSTGGNDAPKPVKPKAPKKRKSKSDLAAEAQADGAPEAKVKIKQEKITTELKVRKKRDRFNGMTEEEVLKRTLPDHLRTGLDICIVGINPGLTAAYVGHHYAGPGNHFWKCLYLSGLIPEPLTAYDDVRLMDYGIGFTNIVERTSRGSADLTRKEIKEGGEILREKVKKYKPKIVVFNGKGIYEVFCGHKNFYIGKQPDPFPETDGIVYVMPSSSARCSQLPRAIDKVPFYAALKKLRDHLCGDLPQLDEAEVCFPDLELKVEPKKIKEEAMQNGFAPEGGSAGKKKRQRSRGKKEGNNSIDGPPDMMPGNPMGMPGFPPMVPYHPGMMMPHVKQEPGTNFRPPNCLGHTPVSVPGAVGMFGHPGHRMPAIPDPNIDSLFANQPVLVKQEDTSDLSKYGLLPPNGLPAPPLSHPPLINSSSSSHSPLVPYTSWQPAHHSSPSSIASFSSPPSTSSFSFAQMSSLESRTSPAQAFQPWQHPPQLGQPPQHFPHPQGSPTTPGHTPPRMPASFNGSPGSYNGSPGSYNGSPNWGSQSPSQGQSPGHCQGQGQGHMQPQGQFSQWPQYPGQQPGQFQGHHSPNQGQGQFQGQLSPGHYQGPQLSPHSGGQPGFSSLAPVPIKQEPGSAFGPCLSQH